MDNIKQTIERMDSWAKDKGLPTYSELAALAGRASVLNPFGSTYNAAVRDDARDIAARIPS